MLLWLNDVDAALSSSKPVGGLPETAKDQLDRFMEVFKELEATGPKVEALLGRGNDYLKKSKEGAANNLQNNLRVRGKNTILPLVVVLIIVVGSTV